MRFFRQLFNADRPETTGSLLVFLIFKTIIVCQAIRFVWIWAFHTPGFEQVAAPIGIANYVDVSFMFGNSVALINAGLISLFLLLGYFNKGRFFYLLALLGMHLQYVARFSQGYIWHGSEMTGMALLVLALTSLLFKSPDQRRKMTLGLFIFFMTLGYTSAGFSKLIGSGFYWADGSNLILWMKEGIVATFSQNGAFQMNTFQQFIIHRQWLGTLLLSIGLATELGSFLLLFQRTRWIETTLLICMHIGIVVLMDIHFTYFLTFLIIVGYPWAQLFDLLLQENKQLSYWVEKSA